MNLLKILRPDIWKELDFERNKKEFPNVNLNELTICSNRKLYWKCPICGYSKLSNVNSYVNLHDKKHRCKGCNSLRIKYPEIYSRIDIEKSIENDPSLTREYIENITAGNSETVLVFKCDTCKHEFKSTAYIMFSGRHTKTKGCPYCSGRIIEKGINDLKTRYPNIAAEWDYEKNYPLTPDEIAPGSSKKVWWICLDCNRSYEQIIRNRVSLKHKCPYCTHQKVISGETDLKSWCYKNSRDYLLKEWSSNNTKKPSEVFPFTRHKYLWKCPKCNKEYLASPEKRCRKYDPTGCPHCNEHRSTPEKVIFYYFKNYIDSDAIFSYKLDKTRLELDIFSPKLNIGIEYDGFEWHNKKLARKRDTRKNKLCKSKNIKLIRIRETHAKSKIVYRNNITYYYINIGKGGSKYTKKYFKDLADYLVKLFILLGNPNISLSDFSDINEIFAKYKSGNL